MARGRKRNKATRLELQLCSPSPFSRSPSPLSCSHFRSGSQSPVPDRTVAADSGIISPAAAHASSSPSHGRSRCQTLLISSPPAAPIFFCSPRCPSAAPAFAGSLPLAASLAAVVPPSDCCPKLLPPCVIVYRRRGPRSASVPVVVREPKSPANPLCLPLKSPAKSPAPPSFADAVRGSSSVIPTTLPASSPAVGSFLKYGCPAISFSDDDIRSIFSPFDLSLFGKFSERIPKLQDLKLFLVGQQFRSNYSAAYISQRCFVINFSHIDDFVKIYESRDFRVADFPLRFTKWSPTHNLKSYLPLKPVWISLPGLPLHFFNDPILRSIGNSFGKTLRVHIPAFALGKPLLAKVLVELNLLDPLPERIWIGSGDVGFWQRAFIDQVPKFCSRCSKMGHIASLCRKASADPVLSAELVTPPPVLATTVTEDASDASPHVLGHIASMASGVTSMHLGHTVPLVEVVAIPLVVATVLPPTLPVGLDAASDETTAFVEQPTSGVISPSLPLMTVPVLESPVLEAVLSPRAESDAPVPLFEMNDMGEVVFHSDDDYAAALAFCQAAGAVTFVGDDGTFCVSEEFEPEYIRYRQSLLLKGRVVDC